MREPDEIVGTVIRIYAVEVMTFEGLALFVCGPWTMEGGCHQHMDVIDLVTGSNERIALPLCAAGGAAFAIVTFFVGLDFSLAEPDAIEIEYPSVS